MDAQGALEREQIAAAIRAGCLAHRAGDGAISANLSSVLALQNPIDLARALSDLEPDEVTFAFDLLDREKQGVVLGEAGSRDQALLLMHVGDRQASDLIQELEPDDAADVLELLDPASRPAILGGLAAEDAREILALQEYDADTAGGLMTPEFLGVPPDATAARVFDAVRRAPDAETINVIYVLEDLRLKGVASIRDAICADPSLPIRDWMTEAVIRVAPDEDQEEVIRLIETYHLGAVPVVDEAGIMLGIVTADDAFTAFQSEASEDIMALAGVSGGPLPDRSVWERVRTRLPWLILTLFGGIGAGWILRWLAAAFGQPRAVEKTAQLLPLVAGLAGNVGMQSAAVMLRGFATGEIGATRVWRVIRREMAAAVINGTLCGVISGLMALAIIPDAEPARFVAVAFSVMMAASAAGTLGSVLPTLCERMGLDPAVAAGPFITTLNDILGFSIYMSVVLGVFGLQS